MPKSTKSRLKRQGSPANNHNSFKKKRFTNACDNVTPLNGYHQENSVRHQSRQDGDCPALVKQNSKTTSNVDTIDLSQRIKELEEINSKNFDPKMAFNYDFVKKIENFLNGSAQRLDFNMAGETLDAATRIFTSKVDIVQKKTSKISYRFAITDSKSEKQEQQKQKKKKIAHLEEYTRTNLAKNSSTLNGKLPKSLRNDPLHTKLSSAYDVSNVSVLMNRQLILKPSGGFAFDSRDKRCILDDEFDLFNSSVQSFPFPIQKDEDIFTVHPALRSFDFDDRSVDMENIMSLYRSRLKETANMEIDNIEELDDTIKIATQVYDYCNDHRDMSSHDDAVINNQSDELQFYNMEETQNDFDDFNGLDLNDDYEHAPVKEIIQELAHDPNNMINQQDEPIVDKNNQKLWSYEPNKAKSGLLDQALFMTQIFNRNNFFRKNFLKSIHSKRFPNDKANALFQDEQQQKKLETTILKKRKVKPKCEPLVLEFVKKNSISNSLRKDITKASLKNNVARVDSFQLRHRSGFNPVDLSCSFWCSSVRFKKNPLGDDKLVPSIHEDDDEECDEAHFSDAQANMDEFDFNINSPGEPLDLEMTFDQTTPQEIRSRLISNESNIMAKKPRYVTDFGEDMDPFRLGEQNRELYPKQPGIDEPIPIEDRNLEYTTTMKKINIKKLKKIMFNFVQQHSWKYSDFQQYYEKHFKYPKDDCLDFYGLIYHIIYHGDLDERTLEDLTIPIFFVATLHLCNDKKLHLTKFDDDSGNFFITMLE